MNPLLAQASFDSLPATWLKYAVIFLGATGLLLTAAVVAVVAVVQLVMNRRIAREPQRREITPQPLAVEATVKARRDYKKQLEETRHDEVSRRIDGHDEEFDSVWNTMRAEDAKLSAEIAASRAANATRFEAISVSLARIETKLGTNPPPPS